MTLWILSAFGVAFLAFLVWLVRRSQKAGEDSLFARQTRAAEKGKQRAREAQIRSDRMSDGSVRDKLSKRWSRPK